MVKTKHNIRMIKNILKIVALELPFCFPVLLCFVSVFCFVLTNMTISCPTYMILAGKIFVYPCNWFVAFSFKVRFFEVFI